MDCSEYSDSDDSIYFLSDYDGKPPLDQRTCRKVRKSAHDMSTAEATAETFCITFAPPQIDLTESELISASLEHIVQHLLQFSYPVEESHSVSKLIECCRETPQLKKFSDADCQYAGLNLKACPNEALKRLYKRESPELSYVFMCHVYSLYRSLMLQGEVLQRQVHAAVVGMWATLVAMVGYQNGYTYRSKAQCETSLSVQSYKTTKRGEDHNVIVVRDIPVRPDAVIGHYKGQECCVPVQMLTTDNLSTDGSTEIEGSGNNNRDTRSSSLSLQISPSTHQDFNGEHAEDIDRSLPFMPGIAALPAQLQHRWREQLCNRHVLQLLATAEDAFRKLTEAECPDILTRVFNINGLVSLNEYVVFTNIKVTGWYLYDRRVYVSTMDMPEAVRLRFHRCGPKVRFFPVALDITEPRQRLALICWLKHHLGVVQQSTVCP